MRVYTDGACSFNPGPGGWAFIACGAKQQKSVSGGESQTTNNRMELTAAVEALKFFGKACKSYSAVEIISDSAYVVNAVQGGWVTKWCLNGWLTVAGNKIKNEDLWREYMKAHAAIVAKGKSVIFVKVKGHSGNTFNEKVDVLAKGEVVKQMRNTIAKL